MITDHLVRVGVVGNVGRFVATDAAIYPRGIRVVCRTSRGLEIGEVLASAVRSRLARAAGEDGDQQSCDGTLLRAVTTEDELLLARLEKNRSSAFEACERLLAERGLGAILVDVEQLFDGSTLYFYFLGETAPEVESLTAELAEAYEAEVQLRRFTETLTQGCGPDCGTDAAPGGGCGLGGCSSCSAASLCASGKPDL